MDYNLAMLKFPKDDFVLLQTNRFDKGNHRSFLFSDPSRVISCYKLDEVKKSFLQLEDFVSKGYYAAGFISYEAGFSFEESLSGLKKDPHFPLLWFGIYKKPVIVTHKEKIEFLQHRHAPYRIRNLRPNISRKKYIDDVKRIKDFIRQGDTYQVNYTFKYKFDFHGSLFNFYEDLKKKQSVSYSAFVKTPRFSILSLSPELFFRKDRNRTEMRPMKGTLDRGRDMGEDRCNMEALKKSPKDRSENVMIVDLLRNDLGRISRSGTVKTVKLFEAERYETLLQMISIIRGVLKKDITPYDLFKAVFPSGSVTGAPKISTMKIINTLEKEPRNIYTGSIGFFAPDGEAVFNVAIRTLLVDNKKNKGEMGIGSGIVYDSGTYKEFEECKLKARFITEKKNDFSLIETILWQPKKGYFLLRPHLDRLSSSAEYFNFKYDNRYIIKELKNLEKLFNAHYDYKVRLLLEGEGIVKSKFSRLSKRPALAKVRFSDNRTSSKDIFLYHKTTNRDLYNEEHKKWKKKGYFDIIFTNENNQITEGAISNIIVKRNSFYYTPPLECGLLNGIFRKYLLSNKKISLKEKVLYKEDVKKAEEIYMINSVRGQVRAVL